MKTELKSYQKFILVTNFDETGEDALVHTYTITAEQLERALKIRKASFEEVYEIPENEIHLHTYEPVYFTDKEEQAVLNTLNADKD